MNQMSLEQELKSNSYPGRGIVIGRSGDGTEAVTAYFIVGGSANSRSRVFVVDGEGIRTRTFDPTKLEDPNLIIYTSVRVLGNRTIVTNGNQTNTIYDGMNHQMAFEQPLWCREFESDTPNYTPRVPDILHIENSSYDYTMSILKNDNTNPDSCLRLTYAYQSSAAGEGRFIRTYMRDGNPLPNFEGESKKMGTNGDIDALTDLVWNSLNEDSKMPLFVRYVGIATGTYGTKVINKNK